MREGSKKDPREAPWKAGLRAARANLVPGLMVQGLMVALLVAYWAHPLIRSWMDRLAEFKMQQGYAYSAISAIVAGALVPELLRIGVFQNARISRANLTTLVFTVPFWCFMGVVVDAFYRLQAAWFGTDNTFPVILQKVLVDQFLYNPVFAAPFTTWMYDWKQSGWNFRATLHHTNLSWYRDAVVPTLFATWGVWIPVVTILYSLPAPLQIPLFGLALSLWVMLYTWMSETRAHPAP